MSDSAHKAMAGDFEDFFENAPCGQLIIHTDGTILKCNSKMTRWLGYAAEEMEGKLFTSFLPVGVKIFHETHLSPLLRMQGAYEEMALEMKDHKGNRLPVLVNASERRDEAGNLLCVRMTVLKATDRNVYEGNLRTARTLAEERLTDAKEVSILREQFIAVLGHDLRSPLGAIVMGTAILESAHLKPKEQQLVGIMKDSANRISHLIDDVMDFARGRLGGDMNLKIEKVNLPPILMHVIDELRTAHPARIIEVDAGPMAAVDCDSVRISQILSNLVSNALVHGHDSHPVSVRWHEVGKDFELSVENAGLPIPQGVLKSIFEPFKRKDSNETGDGLGLGLYITAEIAKAHGGILTVSSDNRETRFCLRMPPSHLPGEVGLLAG